MDDENTSPDRWLWANWNTRLIAFAGAGGTGKSTVLDGLAFTLREHGIPVFVQGSVTREFYATQGLASEAEYFEKIKTDEDRQEFQRGIMRFFIERLQQAHDEHPNTIIICDRTAFDHFSYLLYSCPTITLAKYNENLDYIKRKYVPLISRIAYFPYPAAFSQDVDPDPFRWAPPGKNIIVACLIHRHVTQHAPSVFNVTELSPDTTPQERVNKIVEELMTFGQVVEHVREDAGWNLLRG